MLCDLEGWFGVGGGKQVQEGGDICIPIVGIIQRIVKMWKTFELAGLACLGCNTDLLLPLISDVQAQIEVYTTSSLTLKSLNYINSFPGPLACRWPIVGLLSIHNCMSQYLIINLSLFIYIHI